MPSPHLVTVAATQSVIKGSVTVNPRPIAWTAHKLSYPAFSKLAACTRSSLASDGVFMGPRIAPNFTLKRPYFERFGYQEYSR